MKNILTIDIEDWHQAVLTIPPDQWDQYESRIVCSTHRILDILKKADAKATFFILGRVAADYPELIRAIQSDGHEIGSHGFFHQPIYRQTRQEFRKDLKKSLDTLRKITGKRVAAYRAPWFSITKKSLWALDIMAEEGIQCDASVFPVQNPFYGINGTRRFPHVIEIKNRERKNRRLVELPPATLKLKKLVLPTGGGFYLRTLPYSLIRHSIIKMNRQNKPAVMYIHPWELDTGQPRIPMDFAQTVIHYTNIRNAEYRFRRLLLDFQFGSIAEWLEDRQKKESIETLDHCARL